MTQPTEEPIKVSTTKMYKVLFNNGSPFINVDADFYEADSKSGRNWYVFWRNVGNGNKAEAVRVAAEHVLYIRTV